MPQKRITARSRGQALPEYVLATAVLSLMLWTILAWLKPVITAYVRDLEFWSAFPIP
jgi:type II secretory pathway component PulJ